MAGLNLDQIWAIQHAQGEAGRGPVRELVVPTADPEFGPYTGYRLLAAGEVPAPGWRRLTQEEIHQAETVVEREEP